MNNKHKTTQHSTAQKTQKPTGISRKRKHTADAVAKNLKSELNVA